MSQRSLLFANFLLLAWMAWGCALMVLPAGVQQNWHAQLRDLHAQGLRAVPAGRDYLGFPWSDQSRPPRAQTEVSSARSTEDRLRREIAVLREQLRKQQEQHWRASPTASLFQPELVSARKLLPEERELWQAGNWLNAGRRQQVAERDWILNAELPLIDIGEDHALQPDQLLLAGRKILGQIDQVGIWTSTFRPLTHEEFRCPAVVMNARTGLRAEQSVGSFHGTGEELCELLYIENTLPVGVGDFVVLADPEQRFGGPLILGTVAEALVLQSSPFWKIRVEPALSEPGERQVFIVTERLNRARLAARPDSAADKGATP